PTGVDIRKGNQLACIGCGLCIDACNQIMDRFDRPGELITYDSVTNQNARAEGSDKRVRWLRPRTWVYTGILTVVCLIMAVSLFTRDRTEINVIQERSPLYVQLGNGDIRNGYTFKILNMERVDTDFTLTTTGVEGATMNVLSLGDEAATEAVLPVVGDTVGTFRIYVSAPKSALDGRSTDLAFIVTNPNTGEVIEHHVLFAGPSE
ncbi:MAG: FixG Ig-like domain-containing protein, partial [Rhodospirillaceae bacterium]